VKTFIYYWTQFDRIYWTEKVLRTRFGAEFHFC